MELARKELPDAGAVRCEDGKLDGYGTLSALRNEKATATIPFILMTGGIAPKACTAAELGARMITCPNHSPRKDYAAVGARLKFPRKSASRQGEAPQDLRN